MANWTAKFWRNISGGTAMIIGLALPVIALVIGGAVDFNRMMQLRSEMQDAADLASIGAIAVNSAAFRQGLLVGNGTVIKQGQADAKAMFSANMRSEKDLSGLQIDAKVLKTNGQMQATVTATADYQPYILDLMGFKKLPINVTSTSQATFPPYIDFYLLLDNSPSMGVGATTSDINAMVAATAKNASDANCAFACHEKDKPGTDYYALAKTLGVTTRIDVVRQATQNLMATAKSTETLDNQFRMSIYDFGLSADTIDAQNPPAYQISALTADLTASASNASAIDLMSIPYQNYNSDRQTNFTSVLSSMNTNIPAAGDGSGPNQPQKVLFMVSDGTNDGYDCTYSNGSTCRRITPMDTTTCTTLKARGVRIAVLYTTYLPLPTNSFYNQYLAKYVSPTSQLAANMQACASPGLYFEVGPNQGISEAMTALFNKVVSVVKINA